MEMSAIPLWQKAFSGFRSRMYHNVSSTFRLQVLRPVSCISHCPQLAYVAVDAITLSLMCGGSMANYHWSMLLQTHGSCSPRYNLISRLLPAHANDHREAVTSDATRLSPEYDSKIGVVRLPRQQGSTTSYVTASTSGSHYVRFPRYGISS